MEEDIIRNQVGVEPDVFIDRDIDNIVNGIDQQLKYIIDREV